MKLKLLVGPPGSLKSTTAKSLIENDGDHGAAIVYVNQDSQGKQHLEIFKQAIIDKKDIIVDRMNFNKEQRERYLKLAKEAGYSTEIVVLHESKQTCLDRCNKRTDHPTIKDEADAGRAVNFFFSKYERVEDNEADVVTRIWPEKTLKLDAIIVDIDGTAANIDHRLHYVKEIKKDWKNFFKNMDKDSVNYWCRTIVNALRPNHIVVFCSGRSDDFYYVTKSWLEDKQFHHDWLFMRNRQDYREDSIVKSNILDFEILTRFNPIMVIDDRPSVCRMWRNRGLTVLQCNDKEF